MATKSRRQLVVEVSCPFEADDTTAKPAALKDVCQLDVGGVSDVECQAHFLNRSIAKDFGAFIYDDGLFPVDATKLSEGEHKDRHRFNWPNVVLATPSWQSRRGQSLCFVSREFAFGMSKRFVKQFKIRMSADSLHRGDRTNILRGVTALLWSQMPVENDSQRVTFESNYATQLPIAERGKWAADVDRLSKAQSAADVSATLASLCDSFRAHQKILLRTDNAGLTLQAENVDKTEWDLGRTALSAVSCESEPTRRSEMSPDAGMPMARVFVQVGRLYGDAECGLRFEAIADGSEQMVARFKEVLEEVKEERAVGGLVGPSYSVVGGADKEAMEIFAGQVQLETADRIHLEIYCLPGDGSPTLHSA